MAVKLFYGQKFYPLGGQEDYIGYFDSMEKAIEYAEYICKTDGDYCV